MGKRTETAHLADELELHSFTRRGKFYIDGHHLSYDWGIGSKLSIRSGSPLTIVGDLESKRNGYEK